MSTNDNQREVVLKLDAFSENNQPEEYPAALRALGCKVVGPRAVIAAAGINLLEPLSHEEWLAFCSKVSGRSNSTSAGDIYSTIRRLFEECNEIYGGMHGFEYGDNIIDGPNIKVILKDAHGTNIESVVIPVQVKQYHDLQSASYASLDNLVCKLRNWIDLHGFHERLHGFCIVTDGLSLSIGHITIDNDQLKVLSTGMGPIALWEVGIDINDPTTYPPAETMGLRIVRSLLSATAVQLGHINTRPTPYIVDEWTFQPLAILGRGAFCTALSAKAYSTAHATPIPEAVVIKKENIRCKLLHAVPSEHLRELLHKECLVLRRFSTLQPRCPFLPSLFVEGVEDWITTAALPFIPMQPCGQPLRLRCASCAPSARHAEARLLHTHITSGLHAAHSMGFCHRDIRPDNIVFDGTRNCYVVIDWGLAEAPGVIMPEHTGCMTYCHDDIASAMLDLQCIPFLPPHDLGAARYVAFAFARGPSFDTSDWGENSFDFVEIRNRVVGSFCE